MMIEESILTLGLFCWLFLRTARESEERQELLDFARSHGLALSEKRAARAVAAGRGAELRRRLETRAQSADVEVAAETMSGRRCARTSQSTRPDRVAPPARLLYRSGMCVGCAMAAASAASGLRTWLQTHHMGWLTPRRMRALTTRGDVRRRPGLDGRGQRLLDAHGRRAHTATQPDHGAASRGALSAAGDRRQDRQLGAVGDRRLQAVQEADVLAGSGRR